MVYFILDIFSDTFLDIFCGQIFCALTLTEVVEVRGPVLTLRELDSQRIFTAIHDAVHLSFLRPPPRAFVESAPQAPRVPPQVVRAALPPVLVDNRPPVRRDASAPSFHDAILQKQIADSQPLRVVPTPLPYIADSQPPPVALSPLSQFNGPPPVRKTQP